MMKKKEFGRLKWGGLSKKDEDNLLSFISGFLLGKKGRHRKFEELIGCYLYQQYGIENKLQSWIYQIDHYAFLKGLPFVDGFFHLVEEIENFDGKIRKTKIGDYGIRFLEVIPDGEQLDQWRSPDGVLIKVGDVIRLGDKIGEDFKKTKFFDMMIRNPSWELFYPSDKDFQFIQFYHQFEDTLDEYFLNNRDSYPEVFGSGPVPKTVTYGRVWRMFSGFTSRVEKIHVKSGVPYLYTNLFEIEAKEAWQHDEFQITGLTEVAEFDFSIAYDLNFNISNYRLNLLDYYKNISSLIIDFLSRYIRYFKKDWQNYDQHLYGGRAYRRNWMKI